MIKLLLEKCTNCGLCQKVCHEHSISMLDGKPVLALEICSTCGQCVAVCPARALQWSGCSPVKFDRGLLPAPEQLDEMYRERRTIRFFKDVRISRDILETIVGYSIYAPTNNYNLRAVVVDNPKTIDELEQVVLKNISLIYRIIMRPKLIFNLIRKFTPALDPKDKIKIEEAMARGRTLLSKPAAVVFIVGDKRVALSEASAQYALCNIMYYAQTLGIGSCLRGSAQIFLNRSSTARKRLQMGKEERIFGALMLGYPEIKFSNKVTGKKMPVTWVN